MAQSKETPRTLYLIDGHAQFFRAYHAIGAGMTSPVTKEPTNMTFGFVGILLKLLREYKPDYLAVAIDVSGDKETFRSRLYPEYKANRQEPPEDFRPQVNRCVQVLDLMGIPVLGVEGVEADDVIATIVRQLAAEHPDLNIRIISRDKDLTQLIGEHVDLLDINKDETITPEQLFRTEGVKPHHVRDILALMGDPTDNVPGVAGIGPKTAAQLILRHGSLDGVLAHLNEITGKRRANLEASRDVLALSRQLVTLKDDVDVRLDLESARFQPASVPVDQLLGTFQQLGFNRHQTELLSLTRGASTSAAQPVEAQTELFAAPLQRPQATAQDGEYQLISTVQELDQLLQEVCSAGMLAIDTETDSLSPLRANLCGVSISIEPKKAVYIPTRSPQPQRHLDTETVLQRMRCVLEDESIKKVGHNLKFDFNIFRRHGVRLAGIAFDTMIASYLIDPSRSSHKLDVLALALLEYTCTPLTDLIGNGKQQKTFDQVPLDRAVQYAAEDADITLRLRDVLAPRLAEIGLQDLFDNVEMPLVEVLAELEFNGIRIDSDELDRQRVRLGDRITELRQRINDAVPRGIGPFNPDSPRQLARVLFNRPEQDSPGLGLAVSKRGKTGPSTDQGVLERLAANPAIDSAVPGLIVEYRQLTKLVNTYLVALKDAINPQTGRVHASFNQTVAATGRLSSSNPNLQNIPIRTEVGREIRRAFVAEPGCVLISADYSQIELRLLAHLSEDEALIEAFQHGVDIHTIVASDVFAVDPNQVTPAQRDTAKMVNFGIIYGITPYGLARRLGPETGVEDAAGFIRDYKARFPRIDEFLQRCIEMARDEGYVETILNRRRPIPQIRSRNPQQRALGERMAINSVVQGSAADLIKLAMIDLHRQVRQRHPLARMLLQIHDELVFEAPQEQAEPLRQFITKRMESAMDLRVPLVVESAISTRWIDAK
ncbi:MAG: DNA polymerase I [Planctomycetota bacterium]|nr:DNA polymerase I [Planctomycetota bacterium]